MSQFIIYNSISCRTTEKSNIIKIYSKIFLPPPLKRNGDKMTATMSKYNSNKQFNLFITSSAMRKMVELDSEKCLVHFIEDANLATSVGDHIRIGRC